MIRGQPPPRIFRCVYGYCYNPYLFILQFPPRECFHFVASTEGAISSCSFHRVSVFILQLLPREHFHLTASTEGALSCYSFHRGSHFILQLPPREPFHFAASTEGESFASTGCCFLYDTHCFSRLRSFSSSFMLLFLFYSFLLCRTSCRLVPILLLLLFIAAVDFRACW